MQKYYLDLKYISDIEKGFMRLINHLKRKSWRRQLRQLRRTQPSLRVSIPLSKLQQQKICNDNENQTDITSIEFDTLIKLAEIGNAKCKNKVKSKSNNNEKNHKEQQKSKELDKVNPDNKQADAEKETENKRINDKDDVVFEKSMVINEVFEASENYKKFIYKFFEMTSTWQKSGYFNTHEDKLCGFLNILNEMANLFFSSQSQTLEPKPTEQNTDDHNINKTNSNDQPKDIEEEKVADKTEKPPEVPKTNAEIELQLQTMKQEIVDADENTTELPEIHPTPVMPVIEPVVKPTEVPQVLQVQQQKKQAHQQRVTTTHTYNYQQCNSVYTNTTSVRTPRQVYPTASYHQQQTHLIGNQGYSNESISKNYKIWPYKRQISHQVTPYQRSAPTPSPQVPHTQQQQFNYQYYQHNHQHNYQHSYQMQQMYPHYQ